MDFVGNPHTIEGQSYYRFESGKKSMARRQKSPRHSWTHLCLLFANNSLSNLNAIVDEMHSACQRSGRDKSSVRLVAVTKDAEWPWVQELSYLYRRLARRLQQLADRQEMLPEVEWHLIGQLRRRRRA